MFNLITIITIGVNVILFALLYLVVLYGYKSAMEGNVISGISKTAISAAKKNETERKKEELKKLELEGLGGKESWLLKIDKMILQSNLKTIFPWLTTEIFLAIIFITGLVVGTVLIIFFGWWGMLFGFVGTVALFFSVLMIVQNSNFNKTEKEIMVFMNLIDNYSKTSDDIIAIIGQVAEYVDDPLAQALQECYAEAKNTGDTQVALENLQNKIEHPRFKEVITNLEIASRYEADYSAVIADERIILQQYISAKNRKKNIVRGARISVLALILLGAVILYLLDNQMAKDLNYSIMSLFTLQDVKSWMIVGSCTGSVIISLLLLFKPMK